MTETAFTTEAQRAQRTARDPLTYAVIGAAIEVHRELGPGLLESAYSRCMGIVLEERAVRFAREVPIPVRFRGRDLDVAYRADFVIEQRLILEVKSIKSIEAIHHAQLLTYLKLTGIRTGLIINFNVTSIRTGISRAVL
jgi:GxxExxY protein